MTLSNQKLDRAIAVVISNLPIELDNSAFGFQLRSFNFIKLAIFGSLPLEALLQAASGDARVSIIKTRIF